LLNFEGEPTLRDSWARIGLWRRWPTSSGCSAEKQRKTELSIVHLYQNALLAAEKPIQINGLRRHILLTKFS